SIKFSKIKTKVWFGFVKSFKERNFLESPCEVLNGLLRRNDQKEAISTPMALFLLDQIIHLFGLFPCFCCNNYSQ
ncbi:hypothetical protein FRX31_016782, partial [Thalictrum thalictroides]